MKTSDDNPLWDADRLGQSITKSQGLVKGSGRLFKWTVGDVLKVGIAYHADQPTYVTTKILLHLCDPNTYELLTPSLKVMKESSLITLCGFVD